MTERATRRSDGSRIRVAVVMPAYNEAESLPVFMAEIASELAPVVRSLTFVVVDDVSTDSTAEVLAVLSLPDAELVVRPNIVNRGHGPSAIAAYRAGLETNADVLIHVDGDGQFVGSDFPRMLAALDGASVVHGVRIARDEPWFRRALTMLTSVAVGLLAGHRVPDVNTPLRAYRRPAIIDLLAQIPADSLVPHVHFAILEQQRALQVRYIRVRSLPRRGASATGTMWGGAQGKRPKMPPARLLRFSRDAALEVLLLRMLRRRSSNASQGNS